MENDCLWRGVCSDLVARMLVDERRGRLLEMVRARGFASLRDLKEQLQVSESTIRRDLEQLEDAGSARRSHGGVYYTGPSPDLPHFDLRQSAQYGKKQQIAHAAADLIDDGDILLLDGGSTTYELAQLLVMRPLHVVTNSLPVANLFTKSHSADLIVIGGNVHTPTGVTLGPYADEMLSPLNVRRAVLSVAGVDDLGFYNSNRLLVGTERAMMESAEQVIIVADSTKFGQKSLCHVGPLNDVDVVVSDNDLPKEWIEKFASAGVELVIAPPREANERP
ncbi:MAG: DeoR/GlpR family DNA-binding transcription regulator [bacterium]|nr:DeoR/GlpR family DNA-binding transcription regulator [bacterium]